jgi:peptide/nickel transport system permease protein
MRIADAFMALPALVLSIAVVTVLGATPVNIVLIVVITSWPQTARIVRSEVLKTKVQEFIEGARVAGARGPRIMFRHILPQTAPSILVATTLNVAYAILIESALSYVGLGIRPPNPSWGNMLSASQSFIFQAGYLAVWPGLLILISVLSFNLVAEGLLEFLDPFSASRVRAQEL